MGGPGRDAERAPRSSHDTPRVGNGAAKCSYRIVTVEMWGPDPSSRCEAIGLIGSEGPLQSSKDHHVKIRQIGQIVHRAGVQYQKIGDAASADHAE